MKEIKHKFCPKCGTGDGTNKNGSPANWVWEVWHDCPKEAVNGSP